MPPGSEVPESIGSVSSTPRLASSLAVRLCAQTCGARAERVCQWIVSRTCSGGGSSVGGSSGSMSTSPSSVSTARQPTSSSHSSCGAVHRRSPGAISVSATSERRPADERLELEEQLSELDGLSILCVDAAHDALDVRLHLVHQLHRLEDAQRLPRRDDVAHLDERRRSR